MHDDPTLEELFLRFRDHGDVAALGAVVDRLAPQLGALAQHLARGDAEDLVQGTFLAAIEGAERFDAGRRLAPWLVGILANAARRRHRRRRWTEERSLADEAAAQAAPDDAAEARERARAVRAAVRRLPEGLGALVELQLGEGLCPAEIAARLDVDARSVRVRLHRARARLRELLPAGLAGGAAIAAFEPRALAGVRDTVLRAARRAARREAVTAGTAAGGTLALAGLVVAAVLGIALAAPVWLPGARTAVQTPQTPTPRVLSASAVVDPAPAAPAPSAAVADRAAAPRRAPVGDGAAAPDGGAVIRGRLLRPDGRPAAGMSLVLHGWGANAERARRHGVPREWRDVEAGTDGEGRFALRFAPHPALQFTLDGRGADLAPIGWRWSAIGAGAHLDLGTVVLPETGAVAGRLVDAEGRVPRGEWTVSLELPGPWGGDREPVILHATPDPLTGAFRFDPVSVGGLRLAAGAGDGAQVEERTVVVRAGDEVFVELVHDGPDPSRRLSLLLHSPFVRLHPPDGRAVVLVDPRGARISGSSTDGRRLRHVFDDLGDGPYTARVEDPRYEPWSRPDLRPGEAVVAQLRGNAALALDVRDAESGERVPAARAGVRSIGSTSAVPAGQPAPDGTLLLDGLPSACRLLVEVEAVGYLPRAVEVGELAAHERRVTRVELGRGGRIAGRVLLADGRTPAAGVRVQRTAGAVAGWRAEGEVFSGAGRIPPFEDEVTTDADGRFVLEGVPAGPNTLRALDGPWCTVERTAESDDTSRDVELVLPPQGWIEGTFRIPDDARLEDLVLKLQDDGAQTREALGFPEVSAADLVEGGRHRWGPLPPGRYRLWASVRFDLGRRTGQMLELGRATVRAGETSELDLDLLGRYPGRLRLSARLDGETAWTGSLALAYEKGSCHERIEGEPFHEYVDVPVGPCRVGYVSPDGDWYYEHAEPVLVAPAGRHAVVLDVALAERRVRFVDARSGAPLPDREVAWRTGTGGTTRGPLFGASATTDGEGRVTLRLPVGPVGFYAAAHAPDDARRAAALERFRTTVDWSAGGELSVPLTSD